MENSRKLLSDIHQLLNEGKKSKKKEDEKVEKKSKEKEEELDEGALNESGGPEESPSDEAIHLLARGIEMSDKKMLDQAKGVKGVSAEVKKSLNVIVKCAKDAMSKDS